MGGMGAGVPGRGSATRAGISGARHAAGRRQSRGAGAPPAAPPCAAPRVLLLAPLRGSLLQAHQLEGGVPQARALGVVADLLAHVVLKGAVDLVEPEARLLVVPAPVDAALVEGGVGDDLGQAAASLNLAHVAAGRRAVVGEWAGWGTLFGALSLLAPQSTSQKSCKEMSRHVRRSGQGCFLTAREECWPRQGVQGHESAYTCPPVPCPPPHTHANPLPPHPLPPLPHLPLGDVLLERREEGAEEANVVAEQASLSNAA